MVKPTQCLMQHTPRHSATAHNTTTQCWTGNDTDLCSNNGRRLW